jgi:type 1 glutamine amidotransferase
MISGSEQYQSEESLLGFKAYLEEHYNVKCTMTLAKDKGSDLPGIEALDGADLMVVFCRRVKVPSEQLERIKEWRRKGKPVIGIRTASHAFQNWLEFDRAILGGDYKGHGGDEQTRILIADDAKDHPILSGVKEWTRPGKLYRNPNLAEDVTVLLTGIGKNDRQPVAWCRTYDKEKGGRSFYTSMGYPHDFQNDNFRRLTLNAISWVAKR